MDHLVLPLLLVTLWHFPLTLLAQSPGISVEGSVFCDPCFANVFSKFSYFMPDVDVQIQCKLIANPPATSEIIAISVNKTTNRNGAFGLRIPHVDGVDCVIQFSCQAVLLRSSSSSCNIPGSPSYTYQQSIKSKQSDQCIYSFQGLSFRPAHRNETLCGKKTEDSKIHIPRGFSQHRFRFLKPLPFQFPFPRRPFSLPIRSLFSPPPAFRFEDPRTWFPSSPLVSPPPPPGFRLDPPRTRFPTNPLISPPPPPAFRFEDPRTWFPTNPFQSPSPPTPPPPVFNLMDPRSWSPFLPAPPAVPRNYKKPVSP